MTALAIVLGVIVLAVVVVIAWGVGLYNGLVVLRNRFKNAFAQIDVQLRRRYDLIPNLVETAKGYMAHERETLTAVIEARNQAAGAAKALAAAPGDPAAVKAFSAAESGLAGILSRLMVVVERYPELKADKQMARVMEELTSTENRIAFARQIGVPEPEPNAPAGPQEHKARRHGRRDDRDGREQNEAGCTGARRLLERERVHLRTSPAALRAVRRSRSTRGVRRG